MVPPVGTHRPSSPVPSVPGSPAPPGPVHGAPRRGDPPSEFPPCPPSRAHPRVSPAPRAFPCPQVPHGELTRVPGVVKGGALVGRACGGRMGELPREMFVHGLFQSSPGCPPDQSMARIRSGGCMPRPRWGGWFGRSVGHEFTKYTYGRGPKDAATATGDCRPSIHKTLPTRSESTSLACCS